MLVTIFLFLFLFSTCPICHATGNDQDMWVSSSVDQTALASSSVRHESFSIASETLCFLLATMIQWAYVGCHDAAQGGSECQLWGLEARAVGNVVTDPTLGSTPCKATQGCVRETGEKVKVGVSATVPFAASQGDDVPVELCAKTGQFVFVNAAPPRMQCTAPFERTIVGCLHHITDTLTWNQARQRCYELGADLASPDTRTDFIAFKDYLDTKYSINTNMWLGMWLVGTEWQWIGSGRNPGPDKTEDWGISDPNGQADGEACARFKTNYGMGDRVCSALRIAVCEAKQAV